MTRLTEPPYYFEPPVHADYAGEGCAQDDMGCFEVEFDAAMLLDDFDLCVTGGSILLTDRAAFLEACEGEELMGRDEAAALFDKAARAKGGLTRQEAQGVFDAAPDYWQRRAALAVEEAR